MNCSNWTQKIHDYADGELAPPEIAALEAHFAACPACARESEKLGALRRSTAGLPREISPARELWPEIAAAMARPAGPATEAASDADASDAGARVRPPRRAFSAQIIPWIAPLAVAASIVVLGRFAERRNASVPRDGGWAVSSVAGAPSVANRRLKGDGHLRLGQWLETDSASRAKVAVGAIGEVQVEPNSRLKLTGVGATDHRLELARGKLHAFIWAPPRLFFVDTPAATAVDLGCQYTLTVDEAGGGLLHVTTGYVALEHGGRESIVPAGVMCWTRRGVGPGTPFADDAPAELRAALRRFDFSVAANARPPALAAVLAAARPSDAVTLWHLLARAPGAQRGAVFDVLAGSHPPPRGVTRAGIVAGDATMRAAWADALGLMGFAGKSVLPTP